MIKLYNEISLGAEHPFEIYHISDTHLTLADCRDSMRKIILSKRRIKDFPNAESNLAQAAEASRKENIPLMCTGDLIDFVSAKNLELVRKYTTEYDIFTCTGNHEFSLYVGESWEDEDYRNKSLKKVQRAYTNDIRFSSRIINGVNFVAIDNSYYAIEKYQLEGLKAECAKGLPVVLMVHTPLYTQELFDYVINELHHGDAGLMYAPDERIMFYSDHRFRQQIATETTREAYEYIKGEKNIRAILTGHLHFDYETKLREDLPQIITGTDTLRKIKFI